MALSAVEAPSNRSVSIPRATQRSFRPDVGQNRIIRLPSKETTSLAKSSAKTAKTNESSYFVGITKAEKEKLKSHRVKIDKSVRYLSTPTLSNAQNSETSGIFANLTEFAAPSSSMVKSSIKPPSPKIQSGSGSSGGPSVIGEKVKSAQMLDWGSDDAEEDNNAKRMEISDTGGYQKVRWAQTSPKQVPKRKAQCNNDDTDDEPDYEVPQRRLLDDVSVQVENQYDAEIDKNENDRVTDGDIEPTKANENFTCDRILVITIIVLYLIVLFVCGFVSGYLIMSNIYYNRDLDAKLTPPDDFIEDDSY